jgi:predicted RND superfamily exporter protein
MAQGDIRWQIESLFERWGGWVARRPLPVLAVVLAVSTLFIANLRHLEVDTSVEGFLLEDDPILLTFLEFRENFGNDDRAMIAIRSDEIFNLAFMEKLRAFHEDLEDYTDSLFSIGRMTLRAPYADAIQYAPLVRKIEQTYGEQMSGEAKVTVTGLMPLLMRTFEAMVLSMSRSYVLAIAIIAPLMMLFLASVRLGALSMFPNLLPIVMTLAIMGIFDLPLDGFTLLIGSIALGLAVDDTIHFMHGFNRYFAETGDSKEAVSRTLATSGHALLVTTLVLCSSFLVFTAGDLKNLFNFGFLTSLTLALAFAADVLLAPALMVLVTRTRQPAATPEPA